MAHLQRAHSEEPTEVVFTVNSPGEVATWLAPTVRALRAEVPDRERIRVSVMVLPCMYASGAELEVVRSIPGVDEAFPPRKSLRFALTGTGLGAWQPRPRGAVLYLGGEVALAARIAKRLRYQALIYTEGYISDPERFVRIMTPHERAGREAIERGAPETSVDVVGDLMVDAAHMEGAPSAQSIAEWQLNSDVKRVALFPGSRPFEIRRAVEMLARSAGLIAAQEPSTQFLLALSPFVTEATVREALSAFAHSEVVSGDVAELFRVETPCGQTVSERFQFSLAGTSLSVVFVRGGSRQVMAVSDLALTIPGSNTAEMAAHGLPLIVCVPLDHLDEIPVDGPFGLISGLPIVGRRLKVSAVRRMIARTEFAALPNRMAGDFLVPELRSETLSPADIATEALRILRDDALRTSMSEELVRVMGPGGASERVAAALLASLGIGGVGT